jgi:tRNA (guanine-N7-)-methyltransferase
MGGQGRGGAPADGPPRDASGAGVSVPGGSFFGRRKGQRLRPGQAELFETLLPRLRLPTFLPDRLEALFPHPVREVRLEIGFGGAEHLLAAASAEPDVGFIGCEPFENGMAKMLAAIAQGDVRNIRLWDEDAAPLLARLPGASLARIDLFYPDPWPKRRQRKRRFVSEVTLLQIARALRGGGVFRFASDIDDYVGWTLARLERQTKGPDALSWSPRSAADWREPFAGWVRTRYEAKALAAGRTPSYILAAKVG